MERLLPAVVWALFLLTPTWGQVDLPEVLVSHRGALGLSVPENSEALNRSAQDRASVLAEAGELSHQDGLGRSPGLQMVAEGLPPGAFGEVLAAGPTLALVWEAWLASPAHREVLEEPGWTRWGWGVAPSGATQVWVVRFWKP